MKKPLIELLKGMDSAKAAKASLESANVLQDYEFSLYHIKELTYDDDSPRKEAFENVLGSLSIEGILFVYLLIGNKDGVSFYFGIAKDKEYQGQLEIDVDDIGNTILKPAIEGNFRGSVVEKLGKKQRLEIKDALNDYSHVGKLDGVPSVNVENEEFQGVDRLVDIMSGDDFCLAVFADPLSLEQISDIENQLHSIHDKLTPLSKQSIQEGENQSETKGSSEGSSSSDTTGTNNSINISTNEGSSDSTTKGTSEGTSSSSSNSSTNKSRTEGTSSGKSEAKTKGTSTSKTTGKNIGTNASVQTGNSSSKTREFNDKNLQEWLAYIDEVLLKRIHLGKNKGLYLSNIYLLSNSKVNVLKLGNTARALFAGDDNNKSPLAFKNVINEKEIQCIHNFQFPRAANGNAADKLSTKDSERQFELLQSRSPFENQMGNWLSTNELSVIAGLPQKEVVGLTLKEEVEFGLNVSNTIKPENELFLGSLVKSGLLQTIDVNIDRRDLDKHTFIAGVTGSGKTTTCQRLLQSAKMPFLVIEPAKTEYRVLTKKNKNILIFTLGNDNVAPFRLNPFEFFPHENITSRVDMIKASIESAFDMEAAIPQLIEAAIYRCYEDRSWNIATSKNSKFENPFADGVYAFPTLSDLIKNCEKVVDEQGFDDRLKKDYIGSIKARMQGLLIGSKGLMLDTPRSIDFKDLATKNVILELEEIRNPSEKSLIMGFILANLNEAIRANHTEYRARGDKYRHITLIEEAHRLLSKFEPGDSANKKQGVETFADMLAEVRKYGESLIIVDQIPNKLTPEVLKNTNTKIIHKLFAQDDKEAVGNTMALTDEQKNFLSNLEPGRVILSSNGVSKPVQVQIKELVSTTEESDVSASDIRNIALDYYSQNYQRGVIQGLELLPSKPTKEDVSRLLYVNPVKYWRECLLKGEAGEELLTCMNEIGFEFSKQFIKLTCYTFDSNKNEVNFLERFDEFIERLHINRYAKFSLKESNAFKLTKILKIKL